MSKVYRTGRSVEELEAFLVKMKARQDKKYNKGREWGIRNAKSELAMAAMERELPSNLNPINSNRREHLFAEMAKKDGWTISRSGWPDFLCWKENKIIAVEVKPDFEDLRPNQKLMTAKLKEAGIKCFLWKPGIGLTPL